MTSDQVIRRVRKAQARLRPHEAVKEVARGCVQTFVTCVTKRSPTRRSPISPWSFSSGFTLIELILVMALLSVVLAVSAPALSGFFRGRSIDAEARRLVSLIRYGQSRAVSEGVPVVLWINTRQGTYGLE